jgi:uncharacterized protein (DUF433 family)
MSINVKGDRAPERSHLNRGIYDVREVARLIRSDTGTVARWMSGRRDASPLIGEGPGHLLTFLDLISAYVIRELRARGVPLREIRIGAKHLRGVLHTDQPFAHKDLATAGKAFFAHIGEWVDAGKGGQAAFQQVVRPLLKPIRYGADGLASIWVPRPEIWINPRIQAGASCVTKTRVPTAMLAALVRSGVDAADVADDYALNEAQVLAAVDFEESLDRVA